MRNTGDCLAERCRPDLLASDNAAIDASVDRTDMIERLQRAVEKELAAVEHMRKFGFQSTRLSRLRYCLLSMGPAGAAMLPSALQLKRGRQEHGPTTSRSGMTTRATPLARLRFGRPGAHQY